jgi:acyl-CoA thioester hydrolase
MALKADAWRLALAGYPVGETLQTRYGDMDANAHLNNVAIARLFEEMRVRTLGGLLQRTAEADPWGMMIVHVGIDYLAEGRYPEPVEAGLALVEAGRASFRLGIGLFQHGQAFALADCVMVHLGTDRKAAPIGPALRRELEALRHG